MKLFDKKRIEEKVSAKLEAYKPKAVDTSDDTSDELSPGEMLCRGIEEKDYSAVEEAIRRIK